MADDRDPLEFYDVKTFHAWDYVVFGIVLCISMGIGLFYGCRGGRQRTTEEFMMADHSMSAFPVALSIVASFFSSSTLLGTPAEVYLRGSMYWMSVWGAMVAPFLGAYLFGPFFHKMNLVSVFEYLEVRFRSKSVRLFGCVLFLFKSTLGMGIVLYGPAVALEEVTGFPIGATIMLLAGVCAFYTSIGGMKAVIWSDVFQTAIMLTGMLACIIQGCIEVGDAKEAWRIADEGGRIEFWDFNPDPFVRHTFWTLVVGSVFVWLPPYSVDQQMIQRYVATKSLKHATWALILNMPGMFIIITLCAFAGIVMYAYYAECDPMDAGIVTDSNALIARFVMDIFHWAPGMPGLFVAGLFSGALSSVSSMINSLAAVTWEDFIKLLACTDNISDSTATLINKLLAVGYAIIGIGYGFVFSNIGGTVLQMSIAFNGAAGAPLVGIFILGAFFPCSNWIALASGQPVYIRNMLQPSRKGAWVGGLLGFAFPMWISIGAYITNPDVLENLNRTTEGCPGNFTFDTPDDSGNTDVFKLFELSYLWYTAAGIIVTVVFGILTSFITGSETPADTDSDMFISYADKCWCCLPESCKKCLRCGVDYSTNTDDDVSTLVYKQESHSSSIDAFAFEEVNSDAGSIQKEAEVTRSDAGFTNPTMVKSEVASLAEDNTVANGNLKYRGPGDNTLMTRF